MMVANAHGENEHHSIQNPAIRFVYRGVCLPAASSLPQLYSFHYYAPIVQKRFILAAAAFPRHRSVAAAATQFSEGRNGTESFSINYRAVASTILESDTHAPAPIIDEGILRRDWISRPLTRP